MAKPSTLIDHIATRARSIDFAMAGIVFAPSRVHDEQQTSTPFSIASGPRYFPHG